MTSRTSQPSLPRPTARGRTQAQIQGIGRHVPARIPWECREPRTALSHTVWAGVYEQRLKEPPPQKTFSPWEMPGRHPEGRLSKVPLMAASAGAGGQRRRRAPSLQGGHHSLQGNAGLVSEGPRLVCRVRTVPARPSLCLSQPGLHWAGTSSALCRAFPNPTGASFQASGHPAPHTQCPAGVAPGLSANL